MRKRHGDDVGGWLTGTALAVAVLASVGAAPVVAGEHSVARPLVSNACSNTEYSWLGNQTLEHGESLTVADLGPTHERYSQEVTWIDVYPSTLSIRVGDMPATLGSRVHAGPITATNNAAEALLAISVTVDIERCDLLAGLASAFGPAPYFLSLDEVYSPAVILDDMEADLVETEPLGLSRVLAAVGCFIAAYAMRASCRRRLS